MQAQTIQKGDYGNDSGHEFQVVKTMGNEVCIEYLSDGKRAWFQQNRFERDGSDLELN